MYACHDVAVLATILGGQVVGGAGQEVCYLERERVLHLSKSSRVMSTVTDFPDTVTFLESLEERFPNATSLLTTDQLKGLDIDPK